ncbi:NAD(P)H-dependent oxidoreductase [Fructilactobacillus vespulae]|uniref:NADPH-dependent FMN reductase n=1 Tax=Fructilactobacillus vespulae TaxID=1249630 RepID=UPI0039B5D096
MIKINVILGSSRPASLGRGLFKYLKQRQDQFAAAGKVSINFMDLADYQLPFFYEDVPPMANKGDRHLAANEQQFVTEMGEADGYLIIVPEYNHAIPAVLKNALDFLAFEGRNKPVKVLTYATSSRGGQFAFLALLPVLAQLGMFTLPKPMVVTNINQNFTLEGDLKSDAPSADFYAKRLQQVFSELGFYSDLFKNNPYQH